jgi:hypothetical protein
MSNINIEKIEQGINTFRDTAKRKELDKQQEILLQQQGFESQTKMGIEILQKRGVAEALELVAEKSIVVYEQRGVFEKLTYKLFHPNENIVPPIKAKVVEYVPEFSGIDFDYPYVALQFNHETKYVADNRSVEHYHSEVRFCSDGSNLFVGRGNENGDPVKGRVINSILVPETDDSLESSIVKAISTPVKRLSNEQYWMHVNKRSQTDNK